MQNTRPAEFIALVAALTALVAMSIDAMLPALGVISTELGASHPNDRHLIILLFFGGLSLGTLIFGAVSDSLGRKPSIYIGMAFYLVGALLCFFASTFPMLIIGRFIQGFGAASPRVVSMAMVRDGAKGADMARIMSYVMSVFMLVPIIAPSIGQLVLLYGNWRMIFLGFIAMGALVMLWLHFRQSETLSIEKRTQFQAKVLWDSASEVVRNPISLGYTLANGFIFAGFNIFLATSQQVIGEQYGQGSRFPLWFACLAIGIAIAMILNGRYVKRIGLRRISDWATVAFLLNWVAVLAACLFTQGHPPFALLMVFFFISFFCSGMTFGNYQAMALEPMGHIAGMAAAVSGAMSSLMAILFGGAAARLYDGSVTPIGIAFVVYAGLALLTIKWAEANRPVKKSTL
jgi:DHA1 family bicyclomycin/chloramphenicol resistance-like MFS transporter